MHSKSGWAKDKANGMGFDFPNLPYFVDTDGTQITESSAIHVYAAEKYSPELLGRDAKERAKVEMLFGVLKDLKFAVIGPMFRPGTDREGIIESIKDKIEPVANYLG